MIIYKNKYRDHWLSPYTIMEKVLFWKKWTDPEFDLYSDKNDKYTNWLVKPMQIVQKVLNFVHPKIDYVKIDKWDTWSMDSTLSPIILAMLKQLKASKHGAPHTDDEDVPKTLRSTTTFAQKVKKNDWDTDGNHFRRWDWIMDQMIWSFEQLVDDDNDAQFHTGVHDVDWKVNKTDEAGKPLLWEMGKGPNDTSKFDKKGYTKHNERINNGLKLFGKYFRALWD